MQRPAANLRSLTCCAVLGALASLVACGSKEPPAGAPAEPTAPPPTAQQGPPPDVTPVTAAEVSATWTPEALEELLAPVALYPDPVLSQLLIAATNPQEVLDAGNWLLQNASLKGQPLDDAAAKVGFTPPIRALVQFPETVDMMCMELGWTTEVGEAFVADQAGVLDAVQRLRVQAIDVGNLQSSPQMTVETTEQEGKDVVLLKPTEPEVVYVPQYDPVTAYAPAPAPAAAAPATTTTTTVEDSGHSTGTLVATGVLAFGAGILVNELFDDDDDWDNHDYYYPNYGYGGMPYYPPYPYRPAYGGGYYPSNGYNRPPNYNSGWQNNGNIIINTGDRPDGGYWDRYDNKAGARPNQRQAGSPITAARPNRPELQQLNARQPRAMPADVKRPSADATASNWKGQGSYAGADRKTREKMSSQERIASAQPGYSKPAAGKAGARDASKPAPKVQGSYAGAKYDRPKPANADKPGAGARDMPKPTSGDRGYAKPDARPAQRPQQADRPAPRPESRPAPKPSSRPASSGHDRTAVSGGRTGQSERAASQRGKQSMPQGARSKGGGGGGGKKKQR